MASFTHALKAIPAAPFVGQVVTIGLKRAVTELLNGVVSESERRSVAKAT
jgi:hypothetical protein